MNNLQIIVDDFINNSGYKKVWIAEQLGITQQTLNKRLHVKKNFTIQDANKILNIIGYEINYTIDKINKNESTNKKQ